MDTFNLQSDAYKYVSWNYIKDETAFFFWTNFSSFLSDPSPIIGNPLHSLTDWLTDSLTNSCLVDLIDVTLACEDANSKLVEVVTVADVDAEKCVDDSLVQIWKLRFGHEA